MTHTPGVDRAYLPAGVDRSIHLRGPGFLDGRLMAGFCSQPPE